MPTSIASNIAHNIRQLRQIRGQSQEQLAALAHVPRATWSNLESGAGNPTIVVLAKVASALQVSIEELIGTPKETCQFTPAAAVPTQRRGDAVITKLLGAQLPGVEFDRIDLPVDTRLAGIPHRVGTREFLTCAKGSLELAVAGAKFLLAPGDVVSFRGDQRHSYASRGRERAVGYSVVLFGAAELGR